MSTAFREARDGARDILPVLIAAVPIGLVYGTLAAAKGLSVVEIALMSALVFAGGAQFAAVELWGTPVPIGALVFSTLLINLRHVLMGASLARKLHASFPRWARFLGFFAMADENWAVSEHRTRSRRLTPAYYLTMAALMWTMWVSVSTAGAVLGSLLGDPARFGADFAFTAIFIGLIAGLWRGRGSAVVVAASGGASALAHIVAGPPWHVAAGAAAGILAAYLLAPEEQVSAA